MAGNGIQFLNVTSGIASVLTDGTHTLSYAECADVIEAFGAEMAAVDMASTDDVEVCCGQDLASALLCLAVLNSGLSAFVQPVSVRHPHVAAPPFCRWRVEARWDRVPTVAVIERRDWNGRQNSGERRMVFRTSGTTATAKLVAHGVERLRRNAMNAVTRLQLSSRDRVALPVPIFHMFGWGAAFLPAVLAGASIDIQPGANLLRYVEREQVFDPDVAFLTPSFMKTLVQGRRTRRPYALTVVAGDVVSVDDARAYAARFGPVVSLYGSTELGAVAAGSRQDVAGIRERTVGRPMDGVECRIDEQLRVRHAHGCLGYVDEDGRVSSHVIDGWFPTNDAAEWHDGRYLRILGRIDRCVKRDGALVALADVEAAIEHIEDVASATVVVAGRSMRGRGLVAFCVLAGDTRFDNETLRQACVRTMPPGHVPDVVRIVDAIPTLPSGKPDRATLARLAE